MTESPMLNEGSPSHKHGGVTLRGPVHRINLLQERRGAASRCPPRTKFARGRASEPGMEKGRALRKPSLVGADLSAQETPGDIPTPPRATTSCLSATLCINLAGPWRKTGENWS